MCALSSSRLRIAILGLFAFSLFHLTFETSRVYTALGQLSHGQIKNRTLHLLLPINKEGAKTPFCKTLLSTFVHGYSPIILNWDVRGDKGYIQRGKVQGVHDFIANNLTTASDNDLIFMMDALDVWLQQSPRALVRRYEEHGEDVVIGADKGCWPNDWDGPVCQGVPESPVPKGAFGINPGLEGSRMGHTRPRWANSGTIIGSVAAMRSLYRDLVHEFVNISHGTDQGVFNKFLFEHRVSVDFWFRMFWTTASDWYSGVILNTRYPLDGLPPSLDDTIPYHLLPPLLYHGKTGEVPVVIHFNEHSRKSLVEDWWGELWWTKSDERYRRIVLERLDGSVATFAHNGSTATWWDLCPRDILDVTPTDDWTGL